MATDDYQAQREDEISVKKGETFDVIATNAQGKESMRLSICS